jgi:hypothetical protein
MNFTTQKKETPLLEKISIKQHEKKNKSYFEVILSLIKPICYRKTKIPWKIFKLTARNCNICKFSFFCQFFSFN